MNPKAKYGEWILIITIAVAVIAFAYFDDAIDQCSCDPFATSSRIAAP